MQVKGRAELIDHGEAFDQVGERLAKLSDKLNLPPVKLRGRRSRSSRCGTWDRVPKPARTRVAAR